MEAVQQREGARGRDVQADDKKKKKAPDVESAAVPEGAMQDPGAALLSIGAGSAQALVSVMQAAGGNLAVGEELTGLGEGQAAAQAAQAEKAAFDAMSPTQKYAHMVAKKGPDFAAGGGGGGAAAGEEGATVPPPGFSEPGNVVAFHAQRGAEVQTLADNASQAAAAFQGLAATAGLDPETLSALTETATYFTNLGAEALTLKAQYDLVAGEMASNEFAALALPPDKMGGVYVERAGVLQGQVTAITEASVAIAEQVAATQGLAAQAEAQVQAIQAEIASLNEQLASLAEAAAAAAEAQGGGGEGGAGGVQMTPSPGAAPARAPQAAVTGGAAKKQGPAAGGAEKKQGAAAGGAAGTEGAAAETQGAAAASPAPGPERAAPAAAPVAAAPSGDPAAQMAAVQGQIAAKQGQVTQAQAKRAALAQQAAGLEQLKAGIERTIGQVQGAVDAYYTLSGAAPPVPDAAAGGGG